MLAVATAIFVRIVFGVDLASLADPLPRSTPQKIPQLPTGTALPLILLAIGSLTFSNKRGQWFGLSHWLGFSVLSFATLSLISAALPETRPLTRMAAGSSLALIGLSAALIGAQINRPLLQLFSLQHQLGYLARGLFGITIVLPVLFYLLVNWWYLPVAPQLHETSLLLAGICGAVVFAMLTLTLRHMEMLGQLRSDAEKSRDDLLHRLQQQASSLEAQVNERTQELRKTTERLDFALHAGGYGVWDWNTTTDKLIWNERQCALYGYLPADFPGVVTAWKERIHPADRVLFEKNLARALASDDVFDAEFRIVRADGEMRHLQVHGVIRRDHANQVTRVVGMDRDVTNEDARDREMAALNDRLQLAIQATGYGVWEMDMTTRQMIWDDRMLEIYGLTRENFTGAPSDWHNCVFPEDVVRDEECIRDAIGGKSPFYQNTFRIRRPDGQVRHVEALGALQHGRDGLPTRLIGLDRDITEATELREELRITEERWQLAIHGTSDGVWDWDIASGLVYRDSRYAEMIGYTPLELSSHQVWRDYGHPDDIPSVEKSVRDHLNGVTPIYQCEYRLRHKLGHWVWVLDRGKVVARDKSGSAVRMVGTQTDITQRKELEERLRHGEEMSLQLSRLAQIGAWEWDLTTARLTWSPEMFRIHEVELGYEPSLAKLFEFYPPEASHRLTVAMEQAVRDGSGFDLELPFTSARGHPLWVRVLGRGQVVDGRARRIYGAFQDITGRRDAEETRRQLESQLFQAQKMETLGTLAGGIAHDFNNLLTGILGYQDLALDTLAENDPARSYLSSSREASMRARELVEQILTFSRQADSEKIAVNLAQILADARRFLRSIVAATIKIEVDTEAPCGRVQADSTQIHQVLLNLGSNAAHAMHTTGGTMRLTLSQVELDAEAAAAFRNLTPGSYALVRCADTGHGMDEETRKRIFDPFFTTKEVGQGTGLGLSVVHGIVEAHRGAITVESAPNAGTTFSLYLPIAHDTDDELAPAEPSFPRGNSELIAVVDDEDLVRSYAQMALEKTGYRVAAFDSATQCLEVLRRNAPSYRALLTDQTMPVMKGIELATEVRQFAPTLPIIIMSGYFSRISPEMLAQIGHVALLSKPFTNEELARAISRAIYGDTPPDFNPPHTT